MPTPKRVEVSREVLFSTAISDSAKVTLLMHSMLPPPTHEELATWRVMPAGLISQHLAAEKKIVPVDDEATTIAKLCAVYVLAVVAKFKVIQPQSNLRAVLTKVAKTHGIPKTKIFLTAFCEGARTAEDIKIVHFFKKFGVKKLS